MDIKKIIAGALACTMLGCSLTTNTPIKFTNDFASSAAEAYTEGTYDMYTYRAYQDHIEIIGCDKTKAVGAVEIPSSIEGLPVTVIGGNSFSSCLDMTSVIIPDSVTTIGLYAFSGCRNLAGVKLSNNLVKLEMFAFNQCTSLSAVTIPKSTRTIYQRAFGDCKSLTAINVDEENPYFTSVGGVLYSKDMKTLHQYPSGIADTSFAIPETVTKLADYALHCSRFQSVTIPTSLTAISEGAFGDNDALTSVTIPDTVTKIGANAFNDCYLLSSVKLPESSGLTIGLQAFRDCYSLTDITVPYGTKEIERNAFCDCYQLANVTILSPECKINDTSSVIANNSDGSKYGGTITGYEGSTAQAYAAKYNRSFISLGAAPVVTTTATTTTVTTTTTTTTTVTTTTSTTQPTDSDPIYGDVNGDGYVDARDAALIFRESYYLAVLGQGYLNAAQKLAADIDANGIITASDATIVLRDYTSRLLGHGSFLTEIIGSPFFKDSPYLEYSKNCGYSAEAINSSAVKPKLGMTADVENNIVNVSVSVEAGKKDYYSSLGFVLDYDEKLSPALDEDGEIKYITGGANIPYLIINADRAAHKMALTAAADSDRCNDGIIAKFSFEIPEGAAPEDVYDFSIDYVPGTVFGSLEDENEGRLMQAYLCSQMPVSVSVKGDGSASADDEIKYGDANEDGEISIDDAVLIMQAIANPDKYGVGGTDENAMTEQGKRNADCFDPGSDLTAKDALTVQKYLLGSITELPEK